MRELLIVPLVAGWNSESPNLAAGYFLKLGIPAFSRLGDKEQNEAVTRLAKFVVGARLHTQKSMQLDPIDG